MKKIALIIALLLSLSLFTACSLGREPADTIDPLPPPEAPAYVPEPLDVEFFNTSYQNMSNWVKYGDTAED